MEYRIRLNVATTAAVIALAAIASFVTSTIVAARAYTDRGIQAARRDQTMSARGSVRLRVRSDRAQWTIGVGGSGPQLADAYAALERATTRVRTFLVEHGFSEAEIGLSAIATNVHYARNAQGQETREISEYSLGRHFAVASTNVDRVSQTAGVVTELIRDGLYVTSGQPEFYYTDLASLRIRLLGEASADARQRADEIAKRAGCRIGEVRFASMGVIQVLAPFSTDVSSEGAYDTSTIEKDVQAVVTATFAVEPM